MRQKAFQDNMLEFILNLLYETQNQDITISLCLGLFGKQFNLDRVAVDGFNKTSNQYTNFFEWLSPNGISIRPNKVENAISDYLDLRYDLINSLYHPTAYGVMSICSDTSQLDKKYRDMLELLHIGAFAYSLIPRGTDSVGCVGFECSSPHEFSKEELTKLSIFSVLLGNMLLDRRTDLTSERTNRHLQNILDHMQEFIYVVDKDTYEPIFFNLTIRQTLSSTSIEQTCYKRFHNLDEPCKGCPLLKLSKYGNEYIDIKINNWGAETTARAYNIHWEDEQNRNIALIIQSSF